MKGRRRVGEEREETERGREGNWKRRKGEEGKGQRSRGEEEGGEKREKRGGGFYSDPPSMQ